MSIETFFKNLISIETGIPIEKLTAEKLSELAEGTDYKESQEFPSSVGGRLKGGKKDSYTKKEMTKIREENDNFLSSFKRFKKGS